MAQLPLITDPAMMQQRWKSLLDPVLASTEPTFVLSDKLSSALSLNTLTFSALSSTAVISISPSDDTMFMISCSNIPADNTTAGSRSRIALNPIVGNPEIVVQGDVVFDTSAALASNPLPTSPYLICKVSGGSTYTFQLQGLVTSGTLEARFDLNNGYLIAKEM